MVYVLNYQCALNVWGVGEVMKRCKVHRVDSPNGEIHLVIDENSVSENSKCSECFTDVDQIKKVSKKEASNPLILLREE